jgi:hypothetical protein
MCLQRRDACVTPNPWLVFRQLYPRGGRDVYSRWHAPLLRLKKQDPVAYTARLCLLASRTPSRRPARHFVDRIRRLATERRMEYDTTCTMPVAVKTFFALFLRYESLDGTTLNDCQKTALLLLGTCCRDETRHYTFSKYIGIGGTGFVFGCRYKRTSERVIKVMLISTPDKRRLSYNGITLDPEPNIVFQREVRMHTVFIQRVVPSTHHYIHIPRLYSSGVLTSNKTSVGVVVMEKLSGEVHDWNAMISHANQDLMRTRARALVDTVRHLHTHDLAHNDLHPGNTAFTTDGGIQVFDFGRSIDLRRAPTPALSVFLRVCDLLSPLLNLVDVIIPKAKEKALAAAWGRGTLWRDDPDSAPPGLRRHARRIALVREYTHTASLYLATLADLDAWQEFPQTTQQALKRALTVPHAPLPAIYQTMSGRIRDVYEMPVFPGRQVWWDLVTPSPSHAPAGAVGV